MRQSARKELRRCVASILILTVLVLGGLDAALCLGPDGHLGIETRVGCCCSSSAIPESPSCNLVGWDQEAIDLPNSATGEPCCENMPLVQGPPASHSVGPALVWIGESIVFPNPVSVSTAPGRMTQASYTKSILSRLRSTTLLI